MCLQCPEERQDPPGHRWGQHQRGADGQAEAGTEEKWDCSLCDGRSSLWQIKKLLGLSLQGLVWTELCFQPQHCTLCSSHRISNGFWEWSSSSMEVLTASFSSGYYSYSTYFYGTCRSFNFPQGLLFCFPHQKIKLVALSLEHAKILMVQEWWGGM